MLRILFHCMLIAVVAVGGADLAVQSDEGMFLPNDPPRELLQEKYDFTLTDEFSKRAMLASVKFGGASGGIVSPNGLIVTNHHVGSDAIQDLSSAERDLLTDGYTAQSLADELKCPNMELKVLQSIDDVTAQVNAAVTNEMPAEEAFEARRAVMGKIEKDAEDATGLDCDVVTLYNGGLYHLYRYKKYTDVRLVFAPESGIASFGGDVDNFEYPRHSLDVSFFRIYENNTPAKTPNYFRWSQTPVQQGDLVLVTGHPGTTNRLETLAKILHRRDVTLPYLLDRLRTLEAALIQFSEQTPEQRRRAANDLHRIANARKAYSGQLLGLLDPAIIQNKKEQEEQLLFKTKRLAGGDGKTPDTLQKQRAIIANAEDELSKFEREFALLERGDAFYSPLFDYARHAVRMAEELPKKSSDRLSEYRDSNLDSLKRQLLSPAPIYANLERKKLQTSLMFLAENLGGDHPIVTTVLAGKNPADRATELIAGTKLFDPEERKKLIDGGAKAIEASDDPMIALAQSIDAESRKLRKRYEITVEEPERQAYAAIADIRFEVLGKGVPPDATGTLRLAYGIVKGYELEGETIALNTTFGSAFEKSKLLGEAEPFDLPKRWLEGRSKLNLDTPFNFVSTADTIGGNSGSPVLNRDGELVGINFDRNRHGLVRNFVYTEVQARQVAVSGAAVLEALSKLYIAQRIVDELTAK